MGKSGTICSHAGRQAVFEIGSERLQTKGEKGGRQFELVVETGGGGVKDPLDISEILTNLGTFGYFFLQIGSKKYSVFLVLSYSSHPPLLVFYCVKPPPRT